VLEERCFLDWSLERPFREIKNMIEKEKMVLLSVKEY